MCPLQKVHPGVQAICGSEGLLCGELLCRGGWRSAEAAQGDGRFWGILHMMEAAAWCLFS